MQVCGSIDKLSQPLLPRYKEPKLPVAYQNNFSQRQIMHKNTLSLGVLLPLQGEHLFLISGLPQQS